MPLPTTPALTTDCVVFNGKGELLLIKRGNDPFKGSYALPGGFVDVGEEVEFACRRELKEETGVEFEGEPLLIGVYSDPARDPRGHTVSIAYLALVERADAVAGDDAASAEWISDFAKLDLAFDHKEIVRDALALVAMLKPLG